MVKNWIRFLFCLFFGIALQVNSVQARWETREDATTEIQFYNRSIDVRNDGTYTEVIEFKTVPTKEDGGENLATRPIFYDASSSELKIIKASTKYQGKEFEIGSDLIEDKAVASTPRGFHSINQVLIKFPQVKKGAELYLKYQIKMNQPPVPHFFDTEFVYGQEGYWLASHVKVTSEIPFYIAKNDTENFLEVTHTQSSGKTVMEIQLKRPLIRRVTDEPMPNLNYQHLPWVSISTSQDWSQLAQMMVNSYEKIANQNLPSLFQKIVTEASAKKDEIEKINAVTSQLATQIKYMGDWRTTYQQWFPRNLDQIANEGQGDCKDFSIATLAMLRKLGIQAHVAVVQRGEMAFVPPVNSPGLDRFNHMIVRVKSKDQVLWIDPTNFASYAHGIFPDIAGRTALVFDPSSPGIEKVPPLRFNESEIVIQETHDLSRPDQLLKVGKLELKGSPAIYWTGAGLRASKESIDHSLVRYLSDESRIQQWKIGDYNLTSRVVQDLAFQYEILERSTEIRTGSGSNYPLQPGYYATILMLPTQNRVSDLFLGTPIKIKKVYHLKNISRVKRQFAGCTIKSPWVDFSRKVSDLTTTGVQIVDEIEVKKDLISNQELLSGEFKELQKQIGKCFSGIAIPFKKSRAAHL